MMSNNAKFEVYDILSSNTDNYSIHATDLDGNTQTIATSDETKRYLITRYGTRLYTFLYPENNNVTLSDSKLHFYNTFVWWFKSRQDNIDKMYQALFNYDYNPIENTDRYETETINDDKSIKYGKNISDNFTEDRTEVSTGEDVSHITDVTNHTGQEITTIDKAGFNSPNDYTKDTQQIEEINTTDDNTTTNDATRNNKITTDNGHNETIINSGTDITNGNIERELHTHGNIGTTTSYELLGGELRLREYSLANSLLDAFINEYCYYC